MVTIFAKGIPSNSVVIDFGEQIVSVALISLVFVIARFLCLTTPFFVGY